MFNEQNSFEGPIPAFPPREGAEGWLKQEVGMTARCIVIRLRFASPLSGETERGQYAA